MESERVLEALLFAVILLFAATCIAQELDDERGFNYDEASEIGPMHWGEIREEWKECTTSKMQSPIDIKNEKVQIVSYLGRLETSYKPANATLVNRGHDMMIKWVDGAGHIEINRRLYELKQCHWHIPSEHTINGRRFDMEVHLVHQTKDNRTAVIGIMYKIGRSDSFLSVMKQNLKIMAHTRDVKKTLGIIDPRLIKFGSCKYYKYMGSLTTPPCTQNVLWTIVKKIRIVTEEQITMIRNAVHDELETNARPVQPINDRMVDLYRPKIIKK
ncbi:alpha carbonic anhydrase 7-like [Andrographis paniculata]|uniref:alpha carbonic anhydrase 7-like n=1 Tax=Andrographis paniculata TaxID=175694 RepID=UPI0021E9383C|nr:alpha carbonic anhydrase 7-like [Andrographis paniculata]